MEEDQEGVERLRSGWGMAGKISEIVPIIRYESRHCENSGERDGPKECPAGSFAYRTQLPASFRRLHLLYGNPYMLMSLYTTLQVPPFFSPSERVHHAEMM
jgi:hypothetical protein